MRARHPRAGLLNAGSGRLLEELSAQIKARPDHEHILLAGDLPHAVTLAAVARSDVFLRTTHYDGDAISVREALWLGTPVIATDNGMRPTGVRLVPVGNVTALTYAILEQLELPRSARQAHGTHAATETFGEQNLDATLRLYEEMVWRASSYHAIPR